MAAAKHRPRIKRLLLLLFVGYAALALFACSSADRLIFFPPAPGYEPDGPNFISLQTSEAESIAAFHFPARPGQPTILYSHGNAEDIAGSLPLYRHWAGLGWGVLAYDYPGYGHSTGTPTEASSQRAAEAAWKYLTEDQAIPGSRIVVIGRSVGGGPSVWLANREQPAGLVLISPFTSTFAVRSPAQYLLPGNRFPNLKRIRTTKVPLCVIHGEADRIIPPAHGRSLVEASPAESKSFLGIPRAGHNDLFAVGGAAIQKEIERFVTAVAPPG